MPSKKVNSALAMFEAAGRALSNGPTTRETAITRSEFREGVHALRCELTATDVASLGGNYDDAAESVAEALRVIYPTADVMIYPAGYRKLAVWVTGEVGDRSFDIAAKPDGTVNARGDAAVPAAVASVLLTDRARAIKAARR